MAILGQQAFTLADYAARLGPADKIGLIIEAQAKVNQIMQDIMFREANGMTEHHTVTRTGLPLTYWRLLNRGVPRSKSTTTAVKDRMGMHEAWSRVDEDIVRLNGQGSAFLMSEEMVYVEAMQQRIAETIFYGNLELEAASFDGLTSRYSAWSEDKAKGSVYNVINAGGTGATNTSAWLLTHSDRTLHMVYPKGSKGGLERDYRGVQKVLDEDKNEFMAHETHYKWNLGLSLPDWRYSGRIANIDVSGLDDLVENGGATAQAQKLVRQMIVLHNRLPSDKPSGARRVWYMNRTVKTMLDLLAAEKSNVTLYVGNFEGETVTMFRGNPIRECECLINTEPVVPQAA